ncbi:MAG: gliding motility-associated C-terminal domain-containing protein [Bacteroidetes bacterium]|nr:gliding motility-associated C-terminal domain-containing protein [Bacteroidota bacterium]
MLRKLFFSLLFLLCFFLSALFSQSWVQKASLPAGGRFSAVAFTIGNKGYLGTGDDVFKTFDDFWEYDPIANSWTQKANFGGGVREFATGFATGTKGYIGTGFDSNNDYNDFWEYDPSANSWTQKTSLPAIARERAIGFSIAGKGYIAAGWDGSNTLNDLWEYDPVADAWTQKQSIPIGGRADMDRAVFVLGTSAYLGTGWDFVTTHYADFWEYNQTTNNWTQKANLPLGRRGATGFSLCNYGYVGLGMDENGNLLSDFYKYDPLANSWTALSAFPGGARTDQPSFVINNSAYIGTGSDQSFGEKNDLWKFSFSVIVPSISGNTSICIGSISSLTASGGGTYSWSTGDSAATIFVSPSTATTYTLNVFDHCDSAKTKATISVITSADAFFDYSYLPCRDKCVTFADRSTNALSYNWDFGDGNTGASIAACHYYSDSSVYNVSLVINPFTNCADTFSRQIPYAPHDISAFVFVPNAFSPNDDGTNDVLSFFRKDKYCLDEFEIAIYNRWGEKVFETKNINDSWDGTFRGQPINSSVLVYYCKTTTITGERETRKGSISIVR